MLLWRKFACNTAVNDSNMTDACMKKDGGNMWLSVFKQSHVSFYTKVVKGFTLN